MKYEHPEIEIVHFESEDVIRTSGTGLPVDEDSVGSTFNLF